MRMGYLHDFEPARALANSWIEPKPPLHDIASCGEELLAALDYIAPVFPETVLTAIETASNDANFASRNNKHFNVFVRLLCQLAYDDENFDRAATILLKFAKTQKKKRTTIASSGRCGIYSRCICQAHKRHRRGVKPLWGG